MRKIYYFSEYDRFFVKKREQRKGMDELFTNHYCGNPLFRAFNKRCKIFLFDLQEKIYKIISIHFLHQVKSLGILGEIENSRYS